LDFPAETFITYFDNHRLLHHNRPVWRTVKGGSRRYVERLQAAFKDRVRLGCAVTSIERSTHGVPVHGRHETFDQVMIAADACDALGRNGRRRALTSRALLRSFFACRS
jgi:predicted NAD/FAD-binding protein